ncbi:MAG: sulfite exporter TauE/SafE family protein [Microscillaceae bacterium]|nr:sulfite exporter TauE/SafE family protein [Microscillaceae bacterium]
MMNSPSVLPQKQKTPSVQNSTKRLSQRGFLQIYLSLLGSGIFCFLILLSYYSFTHQTSDWQMLGIYLAIGFLCQVIDGTLGMAYGVSSTTFLMYTGVSPVIASASVHFAEVFTTASSGFFHWRIGNVDTKLFKKLAIPGALGAILGAFVLTSIDGKEIKPYISAYLLVMGLVICVKAFKKIALKEPKRVGWLALFGGFVDASGGGGWGPVVTTTLIASGKNPQLSIGTVNAVEFLIAFASSSVFTLTVGIESIEVVSGLVLGGLLASPLGALIAHKINIRVGMILVGLLIVFLSLNTFLS